MNKYNFVIFLISILVSYFASSMTITSKLFVSQNNLLKKNLNIQCGQGELFCLSLCRQQENCEIPETICEDCVTQSMNPLQRIFADLNGIFVSEPRLINELKFEIFLKSTKFLTISHDSFLNMWNPGDREKHRIEFSKLCPGGPDLELPKAIKNMLLLTLDEQSKIDKVAGVICQTSGGSIVLPVQINPNFSNERHQVWGSDLVLQPD